MDSVIQERAVPRSKCLLRARLVLPVSRKPIENGVVEVTGGRITDLGSWKELGQHRRGKVVDLGDAILMPGLVNAHCHLDYTNMAGQLPPTESFVQWLKQITELKSGWDYSDYGKSWLNGAQMLVETGTTTVDDIEAVPELLPEVWQATPLRVHSFLEMIGITTRRSANDILEANLRIARELLAKADQIGLSPHAPYSTLPALLKLSAAAACKRRFRLTIHASESAVEYAMFRHRRGEMYQWLKKATRDMTDCGGITPIGHLDKYGVLGPRTTVVHANYLGKGDPELLAARKASVAHCPRSHFYFRHEPFPLNKLLKAGVNVALGTDSLASVYRKRGQIPRLSMFEELNVVAKNWPAFDPERAVRMATLNGAICMGLRGKIGEIIAGANADLIAVPHEASDRNPYEAVANYSGKVLASMIAGTWAVSPQAN